MGFPACSRTWLEPLEQLLWGEVVEVEADADAGGDGQELVAAKLLCEPGVTAQDDGEDGARVEVGRGEDAQLGEDGRGISWASSTSRTGTVACGLDVGEPLLAQGLEAGPAVVGSEGHAEELAQLAVEVGDGALWPGEHAHLDVPEAAQVAGEDSQGDRLAGAGVSGDQGEATFADQALHAPAEVLELGEAPQGLDGDVGREGVPLEPVQGEQLHDSSLGM